MEYNNNILEGLIEGYCLGLLTSEESAALEQQAGNDPQVKQAIDDFMLSLEQYALANAVDPGKATRQKTLGMLHNLKLEQAGNINDLPLLNQYSDHKNWLHIVKPLLPETLEGSVFSHDLRQGGDVSQTLLWIKVDYPDEVHDDVQESFIILEGRCRCYIEDQEIELGPGGFLEIPMYKHHDVKVLETVIAVVQRVKVA